MNENSNPDNIAQFLESARFVNSDSQEVRDYTKKALEGLKDNSDTARAIRLFETVRDGIRYNPFSFSSDPESYVASNIVDQVEAWCVPKTILLAACLRSVGIPAAVGFADVRNHLTSPKLIEVMQTDLFVYHGYVQFWLDGKAFKVTPAFNIELCQRFGVKPLVFDGTSDALLHEFDLKNRRHMEYVNDRGISHDAQISQLLAAFNELYPHYEEECLEIQSQNRTGERIEFAPEEPLPPRRIVPGEKKGFEDFVVGERLLFDAGPISREEIKAFAKEWDPQDLHLDEEYAKTVHGSLIASGFHTLLHIMRPLMMQMMSSCRNIGGFGFDDFRWTHPVKPDEMLTVMTTFTEVRASSSRPDTGIIKYEIEAKNPEGTIVFRAKTGAMLKSRELNKS